MLGERVANIGSRAITVVGERFDKQRHPTWAVALIEHSLNLIGVDSLAGSLGYRPLDVVLGHRGVAGLLDRQRERRIAIRIAASLARRDRDRASELGELLAPAGVYDRLLVLDRVPFGVT